MTYADENGRKEYQLHKPNGFHRPAVARGNPSNLEAQLRNGPVRLALTLRNVVVNLDQAQLA